MEGDLLERVVRSGLAARIEDRAARAEVDHPVAFPPPHSPLAAGEREDA
jgi:hypothetical protein